MLLSSQIFIDGGDPHETLEADRMLKGIGHEGVQGQTTNPTLVAKNPEVQKYIASGKRLTGLEALEQYKKIVESVAAVTKGPISIQVLADETTKADEMLKQARIYRDWIPNGVVKFPCTGEGLSAAETFSQEFPVNITLNFSQEQAAAVYAATRKAKHRVFVSPFVGRLDDRGENGMDVVVNELKMYQQGDGHVTVLTASVRTLKHFMYAIHLKSPAITIPFKILKEWIDSGYPLPDSSYQYILENLTPISYREVSLDHDWRSYNLHHDLTDVGVRKFMEDWSNITE